MAHRSITLSNNTPVFGWGFMAVWMGMLAMFTGLAVRDGPPDDLSGPVGAAVLLLFWAFGLGGSAYCLGMPRTRLTIEGGWVVVRELWLWKSKEERFALRQCGPPHIVRDKDSEGDPYFRLQLTTPSGRDLTVAEHHLESEVEAARDRLVAVMGPTRAAR